MKASTHYEGKTVENCLAVPSTCQVVGRCIFDLPSCFLHMHLDSGAMSRAHMLSLLPVMKVRMLTNISQFSKHVVKIHHVFADTWTAVAPLDFHFFFYDILGI